jgi:hypothetical protein
MNASTQNVVWSLVMEEYTLEQELPDAQAEYDRLGTQAENARVKAGRAGDHVRALEDKLTQTRAAITLLAERDHLNPQALENWRKVARGEEGMKPEDLLLESGSPVLP